MNSGAVEESIKDIWEVLFGVRQNVAACERAIRDMRDAIRAEWPDTWIGSPECEVLHGYATRLSNIREVTPTRLVWSDVPLEPEVFPETYRATKEKAFMLLGIGFRWTYG